MVTQIYKGVRFPQIYADQGADTQIIVLCQIPSAHLCVLYQRKSAGTLRNATL